MSVPKIQRDVSVPFGTRTYREYIIRTQHADGTISDSEPETYPKGFAVPLATIAALDAVAAAGFSTGGFTRIRLERTVTTIATAWEPVAVPSGSDPDESDEL